MASSRLSVASLTDNTCQDGDDHQPDFAYAFFNNAKSINEDAPATIAQRANEQVGNSGKVSQERGKSEAVTGTSLCALPSCCVCLKGVPACFGSPPTWADVCYLSMYALSEAYHGQTSFHIRKDVCAFIDTHFELICQKQKTTAWRQTVNMTLSHPQYSDIFVQEVSIEKARKGYYGLKQIYNPYERTESNKKRRKRKSLEEVKPASSNTSAKKIKGRSSLNINSSELSTKELIKKLESELFRCYQQHRRNQSIHDTDDEEGVRVNDEDSDTSSVSVSSINDDSETIYKAQSENNTTSSTTNNNTRNTISNIINNNVDSDSTIITPGYPLVSTHNHTDNHNHSNDTILTPNLTPSTLSSTPTTPTAGNSINSTYTPISPNSSEGNETGDAELRGSRRNRQTTRPEEKQILEEYYAQCFQQQTRQARHSRRAKTELEGLSTQLGWKINRIQRWLDNRRSKDRLQGDANSTEDNFDSNVSDDNIPSSMPVESGGSQEAIQYELKSEANELAVVGSQHMPSNT